MSKEKSIESRISDSKTDFKKVFSGNDLWPVYGLAHIIVRAEDLPSKAISVCYCTGIALYQLGLIGTSMYFYVTS